jgi:chromosome segregation ATPase
MNKNTLFALILLFIVSCSNDRGKAEQDNPNEQTPQVLNDERKLDISSYSKRYGTDIIQELFDEAVESDKQLKAVTTKLDKVKEMKSDSLEAYQTYIRNNQNYWNALTRYSNQLSDSTLKITLTKLIENLKQKQSQRTSELDTLVADIKTAERNLGDLELLMKILVTEPMMSNYQRNKVPNRQTLESVKMEFDSSIKAVEPYAEIRK